jgi:hypothetical protein
MTHPITPPPELVEQWIEETRSHDCIGAYPADLEQCVATQAAQWGADQELDACCNEVQYMYSGGNRLRDARRPKPPSLKEQALEMLDRVPTHDCDGRWYGLDLSLIRYALEQLND